MAHAAYAKEGIRFGSVRDVVAEIKRRMAEYREFRRTYDELSALSDRDLDDLQISRHSIRDVALQSVYGA
jgi:uncharacterized protein YjiS (DUF1127 family)